MGQNPFICWSALVFSSGAAALVVVAFVDVVAVDIVQFLVFVRALIFYSSFLFIICAPI